MTALTGGVTDYHDVSYLVTKNLDPGAESHEDLNRGYWDPHQYFVKKKKTFNKRLKKKEEERKK
jgi:hypothetical protein